MQNVILGLFGLVLLMTTVWSSVRGLRRQWFSMGLYLVAVAVILGLTTLVGLLCVRK